MNRKNREKPRYCLLKVPRATPLLVLTKAAPLPILNRTETSTDELAVHCGPELVGVALTVIAPVPFGLTV